MRILLLLIVAAVAAYFTKPDRAAHEAKAQIALEAPQAEDADRPDIINDVVGAVKGAFAGEGRFEDFYLFTKYSVDAPGSDFVECYGAFTQVICQVKNA
jgi:hypothetical protein